MTNDKLDTISNTDLSLVTGGLFGAGANGVMVARPAPGNTYTTPRAPVHPLQGLRSLPGTIGDLIAVNRPGGLGGMVGFEGHGGGSGI